MIEVQYMHNSADYTIEITEAVKNMDIPDDILEVTEGVIYVAKGAHAILGNHIFGPVKDSEILQMSSDWHVPDHATKLEIQTEVYKLLINISKVHQ